MGQDSAFQARPFVLCGIPLRRPLKGELTYTRRNGRFFLQIAGHPQFGLPFGQDRLIPIWVATLALKRKSREVHFDSAAEILDFFRMSKDGRHYRRIVDGFKRIFAATIFFGTEDQPDHNSLIDWARFHFLIASSFGLTPIKGSVFRNAIRGITSSSSVRRSTAKSMSIEFRLNVRPSPLWRRLQARWTFTSGWSGRVGS
jgi:Replication initiator protein A